MVPGLTAMYWLNIESGWVSVTVTSMSPVFSMRLHVAVDAGPVRADLRVRGAGSARRRRRRRSGCAVVERHAVADRVDPGRRVGFVERRRPARGEIDRSAFQRSRLSQTFDEHRVGRVVEGVRVGQRERLGVQRPGEGVDVTGRRRGSWSRLVRGTAAVGPEPDGCEFAVPLQAATSRPRRPRATAARIAVRRRVGWTDIERGTSGCGSAAVRVGVSWRSRRARRRRRSRRPGRRRSRSGGPANGSRSRTARSAR